MTDEGRISVEKWAAAIPARSSYFDTISDGEMVSLARASCKALRAPGVSLTQMVGVMTKEGIVKNDAVIFLIGAEAAYCLDAATK